MRSATVTSLREFLNYSSVERARGHRKFSIKCGLKAVARSTHCPSRVSIPVAPDTGKE